MNNFHLEVPDSRAAALALLEEHADDARLIAGGTGLVNLMKQRLAFPERLVSLHRVPGLSGISRDDQCIKIGALTRLHDVERDPIIREHLPMLCATLAQVASPRVRAMATMGGAVAHGDPHQDTPAALIALGASAIAQTTGGQREITLETLYLDYYETALKPTELITEISIPLPAALSAATYMKFLPRSAEDYATVAIAARLDLDPQTRSCQQCVIVLGSLGATPIRSHAAEAFITGQDFSLERTEQAAQRAAEDADPMSDTRGSAQYKRAMTVVFVRRALLEIATKLKLYAGSA
ncbi:MAG: carbon-monoxide dehydrogenase medium subunit [Gammaproteobacteria bacterium]|jgi:carbon-monoxide dehydrogenase medium subunit